MRAWTGPVMAGSWPCDDPVLITTLVPLGHQDVYQAGQSLFIITDQYGVIITDR
jgi:hypothetical protein